MHTCNSGPLTPTHQHTHTHTHTHRLSFIVMEHLDLRGRCDQAELGRQVARMHLAPAGDRFGFACDNTIGGTPQPNPWTDSWVEFFGEHRL